MAKKLSKWGKEVKKAMIDQDLENKDVAEQLGYTRQFVSAVIGGREKSPHAVIRISKLLHVELENGNGEVWR